MHHRVWPRDGKRSLNFQSAGQVAPDEGGPRIDCAPMPFTQVIKDDNFVAFIEQKLGANAANVARAANNEDSHRRGKRWATCLKSKRSAGRRRLRDGFALLFLEGRDHLPYAAMFAARGEHFQALFLRTPLQNVDI